MQTEKMKLENFTQYDDFVEKFKAKKTTDDCYTPGPVYEEIKDWAVERYGLQGREIVRPFWPGGDYEHFDYPEGCVVIDNPPFSILAKIEKNFLAWGIDFFLFAPGLSIFKPEPELHYVICDMNIVYQNGANVPMSFVTNLGDCLMQTAPELSEKVKGLQKIDKSMPKYEYPPEIVTAAKLRYIDSKGIRFSIPANSGVSFIRRLDGQKDKGIFGGGFLISQAQAQAQAQAKAQAQAQAQVFQLSHRERLLSEALGEMEKGGEPSPSDPPLTAKNFDFVKRCPKNARKV